MPPDAGFQTTLEAYPIRESRGQMSTDAAHAGTQGMFERGGFAVVDVRTWNAASRPRLIMPLRARPTG